MAGFIQISADVGISLGGLPYIGVIETIRPLLLEGAYADRVPHIYFGNDVASASYISLKDEDTASFNAFYNAAVIALRERVAIIPDAADTAAEILATLEADPRWAPT